MGSTGEPDRKRRHFSSISPTAATAAKKQPLFPCSSSDEKKLDVAVLQYQNQKLVQQLQVQKVEYSVLENKFHQLKEKQKLYNDTLLVVNKSWERLVGDMETLSACTSGSTDGYDDLEGPHMLDDGASCPAEADFLSRFMENGATESCSDHVSSIVMEDDIQTRQVAAKNVVRNITSSINGIWKVNDKLATALILTLSEHELGQHLRKTTSDLQMEVKNFRVAISDLHSRHRLLANKVRSHRDIHVKKKAEHKRLSEELAKTVAELEESNSKLSILKAQRDGFQGAPFLFRALGNKQAGGDKIRDKQKELQDMESTFNELKELVSSRLVEIKSLHEKRIDILNKLANLQNTLVDVKSIQSSKAFLLLAEQLEKSKSEVDQCRISLEKLQVERENYIWKEKEMNVKVDMVDVYQRISAFSESRVIELEQELRNLDDKRIQLETKIEETSREAGRKEIISEFKALVASLPKDMEAMQSQLSNYKGASSGLHSLRAEVQSLSTILHRKATEIESLSDRSSQQLLEIKKLKAVVQDLRESDQELKLIVEMYRRECTDTRDVMEFRDMEFKSWAHVQSLKFSLDEHNLELRVKAANEAEAEAQHRLATAEAEIADLRQKLEMTGREICNLTETLKAKHEEGESYLSEIESIGQAYEDMQTQNQHLLQQITERDDYNIKLVMEGVKARQMQDALQYELQAMYREVQQANLFIDSNNLKLARLEDQLRIWSEQVRKLMEEQWQDSVALENAQSRLLDVQKECQHLRQSLDGVQPKLQRSRLDVSELLVEVEKERYNKKRIEEELETLMRKASNLRALTEGSTVLEKLKHELREYRGILKCNICHERQKEVVIAKCYHLFCNQCVRRTVESRHRKCPTCSTSFGPNDVKPIYI
ncbi:E3 ubiquitin-protein ligase BRE1-like 1 [Dioscorea cayenensis subsp. rotundata]|uniref:E3 ubiquitin protein ligase n=1 Tax=Dioscorea cayennensis subsp. rotundata TaxID=55577 RepID=A0AB40B5I2_DIOCR|nr:E3 ubiquitin-protein ligase BRE1-like 1 [Dioscorea cayenensis subsp. rotundata]